ncbi:MAG: cytochrome b N-terminal domain-containing protein [Chloroflexota bacterium]|nr:cytochrome b N-terminal domain-containing protein [Chloroflexota bacterium]
MALTRKSGQARGKPVSGLVRRARWVDERLDLGALYRKYGRKVFPVHSSFFLGEMALFSFLILVLTGTYLGFIYVPSNADLTIDGETKPEAYASVRLIESIPVANLFRNTHHWAGHVMIASILLHTLRIFFTGTYRKPREINWAIGVVLLGLTLMAGFVGYALPYDSYAVTATGIGFSIARSIPWIGEFASETFFGGAFPTLGSLSRLYTIHVFILPAVMTAVMSLHLLLIIKQKHSQPGYARKQAEPGKVLGVPLLPYQALLAGQLLLLMFGFLFLLSAFVPAHPLSAYGPPGPATPEVKPDWYLLWIYGFLKIVPNTWTFTIFGGTVGPDFLGGLLFPALIFGVLTLAPWMDRTNRQALRRYEYLEPIRQSPYRTASGVTVLVFLGTLFLAAYYDELGMSLGQIWAIVIAVPIGAGIVTAAAIAMTAPLTPFDPRESDESVAQALEPAGSVGEAKPATEPARVQSDAAASDPERPAAPVVRVDDSIRNAALAGDGPSPQAARLSTLANRGDRARDNVVSVLHEMGELAPLVRQLDDPDDLLDVLNYVDSLRASLADSNDMLQGVVRADQAADDEWSKRSRPATGANRSPERTE